MAGTELEAWYLMVADEHEDLFTTAINAMCRIHREHAASARAGDGGRLSCDVYEEVPDQLRLELKSAHAPNCSIKSLLQAIGIVFEPEQLADDVHSGRTRAAVAEYFARLMPIHIPDMLSYWKAQLDRALTNENQDLISAAATIAVNRAAEVLVKVTGPERVRAVRCAAEIRGLIADHIQLRSRRCCMSLSGRGPIQKLLVRLDANQKYNALDDMQGWNGKPIHREARRGRSHLERLCSSRVRV